LKLECLFIVALPSLLAGGVQAAETHALEWAIGSFAGQADQRIAMLVKADVNGMPCRMQLDTGASDAVIWHGATASAAPPIGVNVSFAGITRQVDASPEIFDGLARCVPKVVGTLGNAFFEHGSLSLNLKAETLTFTAQATLGDRSDASDMLYPQWGTTGGHTLVKIQVGDATPGYALLDTGAAAVDLAVLSEEQWRRATHDAPLQASESVRSFSVHSWGRDHACHAAAAGPAIRINEQPLAQATITYCPELGFHPPVPLEGVLGMRSFLGSVITLDYPSRRWLVERVQ
jgi:hypothetical protein